MCLKLSFASLLAAASIPECCTHSSSVARGELVLCKTVCLCLFYVSLLAAASIPKCCTHSSSVARGEIVLCEVACSVLEIIVCFSACCCINTQVLHAQQQCGER